MFFGGRFLKSIKDVITKLNYLLTPKQKKWYVIVTLIGLIGSMFELVGIAAILPFINTLMSINGATSD